VPDSEVIETRLGGRRSIKSPDSEDSTVTVAAVEPDGGVTIAFAGKVPTGLVLSDTSAARGVATDCCRSIVDKI
jgi:hypothetical protein